MTGNSAPHDPSQPLAAGVEGAAEQQESLPAAVGNLAIDHAVTTVGGAELLPPSTYESSFGGEVKVTEASAVDARTGEPIEGIPVYFAGGYGNVKSAPYLVNLAKHGRNAFSMSFQGSRKSDTNFEAITQTEEGKKVATYGLKEHKALRSGVADGSIDAVVAKQQMKKAASFLAVLAEKGIEKTDAILQSEAAEHGIVAMYTAPEKFNNVVLAYSAGISGQDAPGKVMHNVATQTVRKLRHPVAAADSFKRELGDMSKETAKLHKQKSGPGAGMDGATVAFSDEGALLNALRQRDDAPGVALVAGLDDVIYPPERFLETLRSSEDVDFFVVTGGPHGISYRAEVMDQITALFPAMEARKESRRLARETGNESSLSPLRDRMILPRGISAERAQELFALADQVDARSRVA